MFVYTPFWNFLLFWCSIVAFALLLNSSDASDIRINEIMASNGSTIADEDGDFEDWIELFNSGAEAVDLSGWGLSDDDDTPLRWTFPEGVILDSGDYLLIWASGKDRRTPPLLTGGPLISEGSDWRYLDNGQDPGTNWRNLSFDDAAWASGPAPLGYGPLDNYAATEISYGGDAQNKFIQTHIRKTFTVGDASAYESLELRLWIDDGAVVYLNGVEIARERMPEGPVRFRTLASTFVG